MDMKKIFLLIFLLPLFAVAQQKTATKNRPLPKASAKVPDEKPVDGFIIRGTIKGFPDGTSVALLNGQTGVPEIESTVVKNAFVFKGKVAMPEFKIILFNKQQPYITLFLDNSDVKVSAVKDSLESASITGSASHVEYNNLIAALSPFKGRLQRREVMIPQ